MIYLNQSDLDNNLYNIKCCLANLIHKNTLEFKYGLSCSNKNLKKNMILTILYKILCEYKPVDNINIFEEDNCISESTAQKIIEKLNISCKNCAKTINYNYE